MSYNRIGTPRAYVDRINFDLGTGWTDFDDITMLQNNDSTDVTFDSGSKSDLFDLRPSNYATIEKENQAFYIQFDSKITTDSICESNFLAILGHNFNTADVVFKVEVDDVPSFASSTVVSNGCTNVVNGDADADANYVDPSHNGWTLITWANATSNNRYVRITFEDDDGVGSNFNDDVKIGAILYGEYIDFPHTPDLAVKTTIDYDGVTLQDSIGGGTFSNASHHGQPMWSSSPPWQIYSSDVPTYTFQRRDGRIYHDMKFSYISDTDLFAQDMHGASSNLWLDSESIHNSFYEKILGQHNPFLFTTDNDATEANYGVGNYGLFRLADSKFSSTQVAPQIWDISLKIRETW